MRLSYEDALKLIHNAEKAGSIMGVDTMRELMNHIGQSAGTIAIRSHCRNERKGFDSCDAFDNPHHGRV